MEERKMTKKTKLINDIDNDIYNDFVSVCKKQGMTIADKLNKMMEVEVKEYNKK